MSANTLLTSVLTGGTNSHATVSEEANAYATDFVTQGVVGAITLNTGSAGTGSFCVNADASPDMGVTIKAGQAYVTATPSGQNSQVLRVRASSDYTTYVINANSSGSTKYDWIYLSISATNANTPSSDASNVASFVTSRSSSNSTDTGSPPTYGLLLAVVTVANGASSITNSNITDKRFNTSIGAQSGSLIVTQAATSLSAIAQAAGTDANIDLDLKTKGTGVLKVNGTQAGAGAFKNPYKFYAYRNAATSAANSIIVFDTKATDTGTNFSTATGLFTAPVAGFYVFSAVVGYSSGASQFLLSLQKNGSGQLIQLGTTQFSGASGFWSVGGTSPPISLAANDTIGVYFGASVSTTISVGSSPPFTWFGGYLLSAT